MEGFIDWNKLTIEQYIEHLENKFQFDSSGTAKAVFELIAAYLALTIKSNIMTKHYVEIYYPGSLFPETTVKEVESREPIELPKGAYAFKFFDRTELETTEGERLTGDRKNESGMHYAGVVLTLSQVKEKFPEADKLIFNMECNKWDKVIRTIRGNFQPFTDKDVVLG